MFGLRRSAASRALAFGVFVVLGMHVARVADERHWAMRFAVHPDARAALELHCGRLAVDRQAECRDDLKRTFADDTEHAAALIRFHCTRFESVWAPPERDRAPAACAERFGGWIEG